MNKLAKMRRYLRVVWAVLAVAILVGDYLTGPFVSFAILFIIPVAFAARFSGGWWGSALGILLPIGHFAFTFAWPAPWTLGESVLNGLMRIGVLVCFAILIDRVTRQSREIRVLRGLLPICGFCKKIRTEEQQWLPIERFITERSEATFTHSFCPDCGRQHYGEYFDKITSRQIAAEESSGGQPGNPL